MQNSNRWGKVSLTAFTKIIAAALYLTTIATPCLARTLQYRTYVVPRPDENVQGDCGYQLTIPDAEYPVSAVLVVFERGWQFGNLYFDPDLSAFAAEHRIAMMLAQLWIKSLRTRAILSSRRANLSCWVFLVLARSSLA